MTPLGFYGCNIEKTIVMSGGLSPVASIRTLIFSFGYFLQLCHHVLHRRQVAESHDELMREIVLFSASGSCLLT
jgi:hypothetical protein